MHRTQAYALASLFALAACSGFPRKPVTEVNGDVNLNSRWQASLVTPSALAGAVQVNGTAWMQPGVGGEGTRVSLKVANATPGGLHPWSVRRGQCGADEGEFRSGVNYKPLKIEDDGRGESWAAVSGDVPTSGNYYVSVYASAANPGTVVACGNLAPPAR
jgi:hypothetical protein